MGKTKVQNRSTKGDPVLEALPAACSDERAAVEFLELQRWADKPACPHCGDVNVYTMKNRVTGERQENFRWRCNGCKAQFTVRTGTVFEDSRIPLHHWCYGFWRAATSKKGVSALEIHRQTGLSYKSSLFLLHRIRYAMADSAPGLIGPEPGSIVEVDETYVGGRPKRYSLLERRKNHPKQIVAAALERGGSVKTRIVANVTGETLKPFVRETVAKSARLMTDELRSYNGLAKEYAGHETVKHGTFEYARGDVTTNTIEGFFSIMKRGLNGIYHAVSKEHLHRYLAEFEFRYNHRGLEDGPRTLAAIRASEGKRLTYEQSVAKAI